MSTSASETGAPSPNVNNSANSANPGSTSVVGGVEEVSGLQYSAISMLDRQYEAPVGQRLLLFVRTNANCCLQGGVETILKLQKSNSKSKTTGKMAPSSSNGSLHSGYGSSANVSVEGDAANTNNADTTNSANGDPFSFLHEPEDHTAASSQTSDLASSGQTQRGKGHGPNLGRFLKKVAKVGGTVAKNTTISLERGMQELAIKADQGRNPDLLTVGLFTATTGGELVAMTDSVPLPRISSGVAFSIPLWIPPRLDDTRQVTLKLFIHSQASLMITATGKAKTKHFLLGQAQLSVGQMRQLLLQQRKGFFPLPLSSQLVADGQLHLCAIPDLKLPALQQRGWSLIDPRFSGFASGLFNPPLDQSYLWDTPQQQQWLIATERAMESTLVLPLAAAYAKLCAKACQVSMQHSRAVASYLLSKRTEQKDPGQCARVQVDIHHLQIDTMTQQQQQQQQQHLSLSYQPPDSIFELELLPSVSVNVVPSSQQQPSVSNATSLSQPTLQFFPPVCTTGILPAILKAYGGRMPPAGYMLGNLRLQIPVPTANRNNPELWEAIVVLEQYVQQQQQQQNNNTTMASPMQFPVYSLTTGHKMGSISLSLSILLEAPAVAVPPPVSPKGGLVALVGLENLVEGVTPSVDFDCASAATVQQPQQAEEIRRRQQQLTTMGSFVSHAYLDQHIRSRRQVDLELFQERAQKYQAALERPASGAGVEPLFSWQDMNPRPFRPSSSRLEILLSGIPFNTHNASMSLDMMDANDNKNSPQPDGAIFQNITCGAFADHASGFSNVFSDFSSPVGSVSGGLRRLESKRNELAQVVRQAQTQLIEGVADFFRTARQQQKYLNHVPARQSNLQSLRWKVFEAIHAYHHVTWICAVRRATTFSQALGIAVTSYLTSLSDVARCQVGWPELWARHGYLVSYEGLLSAAGKELGMIEDASVAIKMLHMVRVVLVPDDGTSTSNVDPDRVVVPHSPLLKWVQLVPSPNGAQTQYLLQIGVHSHYFEQRIPPCLKNGTGVQLFPVLFQVGVDIRQWGAHAGSNMKNQFATSDNKESTTSNSNTPGGLLDDEDDDAGVSDDDVLVALNYEALGKINTYAHLISPIQGGPQGSAASGNPFDAYAQPQQQSSQQQLSGMSVHPSLSMLHSHIMTSAGKMNHSILDEAATMAQQLGGGGVVFCKSGKDRTAMHVTYKQAQFANRFCQQRYSAQEVMDTTLADATRMRIYGTRLPICEKNVGQALYAFNSLQSKFMPDALKPPPNTLAGFLKGGRVFGQGGIES